MTAATFTSDLGIVLGVAALTSMVARKFRQPSVLGYLLAGSVVGPHVPIPVFADPHRVEALAEFGVVLVMFAVGLEFRIKKLKEVLPTSGLAALVQVSFLIWAGITLGQLLDWTMVESVFLGASLCISSTMLVSKVFAERPVSPDVRANVLGILVLQDIAAIVLMAAMTALAAGGGLEPKELAMTLLRLGGVLVAMLGLGIFVIPRVIRAVAKTEDGEMLVVVAVGTCFVVAELAAGLGYSVALGAFVAGMLVAESGRAHDVEVLIAPLRDVFVAIFFVSIGMTVDPAQVWEHLPVSLIVFGVVVVGQLLSVTVGGLLSGNGLRRSLTGGLALGQLGEFSFILSAIGITAGVVRPALRPILVTVAILTAFTTPVMLGFGPALVGAVDRCLPNRLRHLLQLHETWIERLKESAPEAGPQKKTALRRALRTVALDGAASVVIVSVASRWSQEAASWLGTRRWVPPGVAPYAALGVVMLLVVPLLYAAVKSARLATRLLVELIQPAQTPETLAAKLSRRTLYGVAMLAACLAIGVPAIAIIRPLVGAPVGALLLGGVILASGVHLWRTTSALDLEFESGIEKLTALLARQTLPAPLTEPADPTLLPGLEHATALLLAPQAPAIGQSLTQLDLRASTGATVVAIKRDGEVQLPTGREPLIEGDVLALVGTQQSISHARRLLLGA